MTSDTSVLSDIRHQPVILSSLLERIHELHSFAREHLTPAPGGHLHAYGSGDGQFAARTAAPALAGGAGLSYHAHTALHLQIYQSPHLGPADRVLAVSPGNDSECALQAGAAARAAGSPLARLGDITADSPEIDATAYFEPTTAALARGPNSSYSATLAALLLAFPPLRDSPWRVDPAAMAALVEQLPALIDLAHRQLIALAARHGATLAGIHLLSAGPHLPSADYGAARLAALTRLPVWSDDLEEFTRHRCRVAEQPALVMFLVPEPRLARLASDSAEVLNAMGFTTVSLEPAGCPVSHAQHRVALPALPEALAGLAFAPPLQLLAHHLATIAGRDPERASSSHDGTLPGDTLHQVHPAGPDFRYS